MEGYINQVNQHIENLVKISITERQQNGLGISFLDFSKTNSMDCRYVGLSNQDFPAIVRERYLDIMTSVPNSVLFFLIYDGENELLYQVDLDKNSTFYESQNQAEQSK